MMRRSYVLATLALATLLPACGELSRTEIMVVVEADEGVQLDASSLRFQVWGRRSDVPVFGDPLFDDRFESIAFPRRFGVVPDGNDASRFIRVQIVRRHAASRNAGSAAGVVDWRRGRVPSAMASARNRS